MKTPQIQICVLGLTIFSYESPGTAQAENFIGRIKKVDGMLQPVVDVEFYGDKGSNPPEAEGVKIQLRAYIDKVNAEYLLRPIIYATKNRMTYTLEMTSMT